MSIIKGNLLWKLNLKKSLNSYTRLILLSYVFLILLRVSEYWMFSSSFTYDRLLIDQLWGLLMDFVFVNIILVIFFFPFYLIHLVSTKLPWILFLLSMCLIVIAHLSIIEFFIYAKRPLDVFVFRIPISEMVFTIKTSNIKYGLLIILVLANIISGLIVSIFLNQFRTYKVISYFIAICMFLSAFACYPLFHKLRFTTLESRNVIMNKSLFFYKQSLNYFITQTAQKNIDETIIVAAKNSLFSPDDYFSEEYPFLHKDRQDDKLGPLFNCSDSFPNFVIIIVEGLGDKFIHSYKGLHLMPFLEDLSSKSLYWNHFLTLGERSFAVIPSTLGSLPYGETGFSLLNYYPRHLTLVNFLKQNGYHTSFFDGQTALFHDKARFLEFNNIDLVSDNECFNSKYDKIIVKEFGNYFWGYNDSDLLNHVLEVSDSIKNRNKLEIIFTGSMHSPFAISDGQHYDTMLDSMTLTLGDQTFFENNNCYLRTILFTDNALKSFFEKYKQKSDYKKTIFIITGDHPMTELPMKNALEKYHVPLLIYSPMLNQSAKFQEVNSHLDVFQSLLSFLHKNYKFKIPAVLSNLGGSLDTSCNFKNKRTIFFMNDNREINDVLSDNYFLSNKNELYLLKKNFELELVNLPAVKIELNNKIESFKTLNFYACQKDRIIPDSVYIYGIHKVNR